MNPKHKHKLVFIHGMVSSGQGFKAKLLRDIFPDMLTPDFNGSLDERMQQLRIVLSGGDDWSIVGSSLGGLMATMFACQAPVRVAQLVLLAPALTWPDFVQALPPPISVPTTVFHGRRDDVIPLDLLRPLAEQIFLNLQFHVMDDNHRLHTTVEAIDWQALVGSNWT